MSTLTFDLQRASQNLRSRGAIGQLDNRHPFAPIHGHDQAGLVLDLDIVQQHHPQNLGNRVAADGPRRDLGLQFRTEAGKLALLNGVAAIAQAIGATMVAAAATAASRVDKRCSIISQISSNRRATAPHLASAGYPTLSSVAAAAEPVTSTASKPFDRLSQSLGPAGQQSACASGPRKFCASQQRLRDRAYTIVDPVRLRAADRRNPIPATAYAAPEPKSVFRHPLIHGPRSDGSRIRA